MRLTVFLLGLAGCANLSGLSDIGSTPAAADAGAEGAPPAGQPSPGSGSSSGTGAPSGTEDAALAEDAAPPSPEASAGDASEPPRDAAADVDAAAVCHAQCSGCCDATGTCHGGKSTGTCGSAGAQCVDCAASGKVCGQSATCVAASVADSGPPPMCVVSQCTNTCPLVPLLEAPCCKPDQTCGCGAVLGILCN